MKKQTKTTKKMAVKNRLMRSADERSTLFMQVCEMMRAGTPAVRACKELGLAVGTFFSIVEQNQEFAEEYTRARKILLEIWAEDVVTEPERTPHFIDENGVKRYDAPAVNLARLKVDAKKWTLSKLLPRQYGDKVTQEHVGAGGGAIVTANVDLTRLDSGEIDNLESLMTKLLTQAPKV